jgi:hypothetical protein
MPDRFEKIPIPQLKEALSRSGYLLESRLEAILRAKSYYVEANSAYPDPDTGKSRELDLYAMSALRAGPEEYDYIFAVLLIECINNPQPMAFISKEPQVPFLHHSEAKLSGLPVKIQPKGAASPWISLADYLEMQEYHHYCEGRIATQFCSFVEKKRQNQREWMATHDEAHFDAFRKLSAAVDHVVDKHFKSWTFGGRERVNVEFYYPILVVQGDLLDVRPGKRSLRATVTSHIQFRRSAFAGREETTYQIDVVTERVFPRYLEIVGQEMSKTARLLRRRHQVVRKAIDNIVRAAKRLRSPEKIRAAMELR